jgi:hypothetical protein
VIRSFPQVLSCVEALFRSALLLAEDILALVAGVSVKRPTVFEICDCCELSVRIAHIPMGAKSKKRMQSPSLTSSVVEGTEIL